MAGLICRYEIIAQTVCKWFKRKSVWKYIFVSEDVKYSGEEAIDVWQGRIRGIKMEIEKVLKKQDEDRKENEKRDKENEEWKAQQDEKWAKN